MATWAELTAGNNQKVIVNLDLVRFMAPSTEGTLIFFAQDHSLVVQESQQDIAAYVQGEGEGSPGP
jgi:hypothetical protein